MQTNETTSKQIVISFAVFYIQSYGYVWVNAKTVGFYCRKADYYATIKAEIVPFVYIDNTFAFRHNDYKPVVGNFGYSIDGTICRVLSVDK